MQPLSPEAVAAAIRLRKHTRWDVRTCAICDEPIGYVFAAGSDPKQPLIGFDSGCGCNSINGFQQSNLTQFTEHFNRQTPDIRKQLWTEFVAPVTVNTGTPLPDAMIINDRRDEPGGWAGSIILPLLENGAATAKRGEPWQLHLTVRGSSEQEVRAELEQALNRARMDMNQRFDRALLAVLVPS